MIHAHFIACPTCPWSASRRLARPGAGLIPLLVLSLLAAAAASAQDPTTMPAAAPGPPGRPQPTTGPATAPATGPAPATRPTTAPATSPAEPGLLMNFQDAPLQAVLEYLSEKAGLIILDGTSVEGRVTIMSRSVLTINEAIALLDTVLKDKGYAAIRSERTLKIMPVEQAVKEDLPVFSGSDPEKVPLADRLVTQIIPIRYADATKLRTDLAPLISPTATFAANKDSNSLILVDTQKRIRRIMTVISALDASMAGVAEVKVYQLKYAAASTTGKLLTELFKQEERQTQAQGGSVRFGRSRRPGGDRGSQDSQQGTPKQRVIATADDRTNTLVVSAPPDMLKIVDGIIKELDSDPTEEQSVFVYPLKNADAANLETVLNSIFSATGTSSTAAGARAGTSGRASRFSRFFGGGAAAQTAAGAGDLAGQVYVVADKDTNSLLVRTASRFVERVKGILDELDRPIRQVLIKVLIAEVTHDDSFDLGTEFSILNLRYAGAGEFTIDLGGTPDRQSGGFLTANVDAGLTAVFNALRREGRLDVLSRPYVLASDNKEATITVGQEVPFLRNSRTTEAGQIINTIEYEDVGIILRVTPHVNPEGLVIMTVSPEISSISDTTVQVADVQAQVYSKRSATTVVAVPSGQTIVIGGLMEDRITDVVRKVPVLGDLPLLNLLFRRTTKRTVKTELLIFLTPRVADQPPALQQISKDEASDAKSLQDAAGPGAFQQHMNAMRRGAATRPAGKADETQP